MAKLRLNKEIKICPNKFEQKRPEHKNVERTNVQIKYGTVLRRCDK